MAVDRQRLNAELRTMRALIEKDPAVKARFDRDGNGVIDGYEWDEVRQLVIQRLEREDAERQQGERAAAEAGEKIAAATAGPGAVAQEIYESDLPAADLASARSIGDADEIILEQQGGVVGAVLEGITRRRYAVFAGDGELLASVEQLESQMLQGLVPRSPFEIPDLNFRVADAATGDVWNFRRSQSVGSDQIEVTDATGRLRAIVSWRLALLRRKYAVEPSGEGGSLTVQSNLLRPFTLSVLDCVDDEIGAIERGWSGLGAFLTGANRMRVKVRPGELVPEHRFGLVAACLLEDLAAEERDD